METQTTPQEHMEPFSADLEPLYLPLSSTYSGKEQTKGVSIHWKTISEVPCLASKGYAL